MAEPFASHASKAAVQGGDSVMKDVVVRGASTAFLNFSFARELTSIRGAASTCALFAQRKETKASGAPVNGVITAHPTA